MRGTTVARSAIHRAYRARRGALTVRRIDVTGPSRSCPASEVSAGRHEPAAKTCWTLCPVAALPSPKSHVYDADAHWAVSVTVSGARPVRAVVAMPHPACAAGANASAASAAKATRRTARNLPADRDGGDDRDQVERRMQHHAGHDAVGSRSHPGEHAAEHDDDRQRENEAV